MVKCVLSNEELIHLSKTLFFFIHSWLNGENYDHCFFQVLYLHEKVIDYLTAKVNELKLTELSDDDKRLCVLYYLVQTTVFIAINVFEQLRECPTYEVVVHGGVNDSRTSFTLFVTTMAPYSKSPETSL